VTLIAPSAFALPPLLPPPLLLPVPVLVQSPPVPLLRVVVVPGTLSKCTLHAKISF
jgi:hypothetical protein